MPTPPPPRTRYCSRCLTTFPTDVERCTNLGCRSARPPQGWGELLEAGEIIDRTYQVKRRLAIGGAGVTYLAREVGVAGGEVGPYLAIKVLYQQRDQGPYLRRLSTEAQILQGLNHPQIVECRGFVHRAGHSPYLVTRFMEGASLLDHVRRVGTLSPRVAAAIGRQVCWALGVAHAQGVIHRDLKPENVLLEKEVPRDDVPFVRVADFGIAKISGAVGDKLTRVGAFVGTPQYAAPEQFEGAPPVPATDVYAVGALVYFCMTARTVAEHIADVDGEEQRDYLLRFLPPRLPELAEADRVRMEATLAAAMAPEPGGRASVAELEQLLGRFGAEGGHAAIESGAPPPAVHQTITLPPPPTDPAGLVTPEPRPGPPPPPPVASISPQQMPVPPRVAAPDPTASNQTASAGAPALAPVVSPPPAPPPRASGPPTPLPPVPPPSAPPAPRVGALPGAPTPKARARGGSRLFGCFMAAFAALLVGAVVALGGGWLWTHRYVELTADDPATTDDWTVLAGALGREGVRAERACNAPPYLAIAVVVDGGGFVQRLELLNYGVEPIRACMERELQGSILPRKGTATVRVAVTLRD